jgi:hypothetical protein
VHLLLINVSTLISAADLPQAPVYAAGYQRLSALQFFFIHHFKMLVRDSPAPRWALFFLRSWIHIWITPGARCLEHLVDLGCPSYDDFDPLVDLR